MKRIQATRMFAAFALLLAVMGACGPSPGQNAETGWTSFRGNPAQTGVTGSGLPEKLELLWTYEAGEAVESTAAIAGQTVFVGTDAGRLLALSLKDGQRKWEYGTNGPIKAAPAVNDGRVFIGDGSGTFHAVSADDGRQLWTFKTGQEIISSANFSGAHVLVGS